MAEARRNIHPAPWGALNLMVKKNKAAAALGKKGGKAGRGKCKARSTEQARAAAVARWKKYNDEKTPIKIEIEVTEAHSVRALNLVTEHEKKYGKLSSFYTLSGSIAKLISEVESGSNEMAKWNPPSVAPIPTSNGVLCDAYLAVTIESARPCVLTYIHESAQWTTGEGDTQRIVKWRYITPPAVKHVGAINPTDQELWFMDQISLRNMEVSKERARLDWLTKNASVDIEEYRGGSLTDGGTPWYCWRFSSPLNDKHEARAAIDAAANGVD